LRSVLACIAALQMAHACRTKNVALFLNAIQQLFSISESYR
jgi:hypothetical protein